MTILGLMNLVTTSCIRILRNAIKQRTTIAQIQRYDSLYDGDFVKSSLAPRRVFFVSFIPLLLFGIVIWKFPALAVAQSPGLTSRMLTKTQVFTPGTFNLMRYTLVLAVM
jgi:hypothetical protein